MIFDCLMLSARPDCAEKSLRMFASSVMLSSSVKMMEVSFAYC